MQRHSTTEYLHACHFRYRYSNARKCTRYCTRTCTQLSGCYRLLSLTASDFPLCYSTIRVSNIGKDICYRTTRSRVHRVQPFGLTGTCLHETVSDEIRPPQYRPNCWYIESSGQPKSLTGTFSFPELCQSFPVDGGWVWQSVARKTSLDLLQLAERSASRF
jgi:hypothetical protein